MWCTKNCGLGRYVRRPYVLPQTDTSPHRRLAQEIPIGRIKSVSSLKSTSGPLEGKSRADVSCFLQRFCWQWSKWLTLTVWVLSAFVRFVWETLVWPVPFELLIPDYVYQHETFRYSRWYLSWELLAAGPVVSWPWNHRTCLNDSWHLINVLFVRTRLSLFQSHSDRWSWREWWLRWNILVLCYFATLPYVAKGCNAEV